MQPRFSFAGHGLLVTPSRPCELLVTDDDELIVAHDAREVARFTPGTGPAGDVSWLDPRRAVFGAGGPRLELAVGTAFSDVFLDIQTSVGSDDAWSVLAPGFACDLPANVLLVPAQPGDPAPYFELHAQGGDDEMICFQPRQVPADLLRIGAAPYQTMTGPEPFVIPSRTGTRSLRTFTLDYELQDEAWQQLAIVVPLDAHTSMVVKAQATAPRVPLVFDAARQIAATLEPLDLS